MDFIDQMKTLSARISEQSKHAKNEEGTKNYLIMPFIISLGYDVFNPNDVVPEFTCDFPGKSGKKVDYVIKKDGKPFMIFECKSATESLNYTHVTQLHQYFSDAHYSPGTDARFGVLTNGVVYEFYTDLEKLHIMDAEPFLKLDMYDLDNTLVKELEAYGKGSSVDIAELHKRAKKLKYSKKIKEILEKQLDTPSNDFVSFFVGLVYSGVKTEEIEKEFKGIIPDAFKEFIAKKCKEPVPPSPPPVIDKGGGGMGIQAMQLKFWNGFKEHVQNKSTSLRLTHKAHPQNWYNISLGRPKAHISLTVNTKSNLLRCEIYIPDSKELFNELVKQKDEIEDDLNEKLEWIGLPDKRASSIRISRSGNIKEPDEREEQFEWFKTQAELFQKVFPKYIKENRK